MGSSSGVLGYTMLAIVSYSKALLAQIMLAQHSVAQIPGLGLPSNELRQAFHILQVYCTYSSAARTLLLACSITKPNHDRHPPTYNHVDEMHANHAYLM